MQKNILFLSAATILSAVALSGCTTAKTQAVVIKTPVVGESSLAIGLAPEVAKSVNASGNIGGADGFPLTVLLAGSNDGTKVNFNPGTTTATVDGVTYKLFDPDAELTAADTKEPFGVILQSSTAGADPTKGSVGIVGLIKGPLTAQVTPADVQGAVVFVGTPTSISSLPKATANYTGTFAALGAIDPEFGDFTATADFGPAKKVTGVFTGDNVGVSGVLDAKIVENGFTGKIKAKVYAESVTLNTGGIFVGAGANSIVGAGTTSAGDAYNGQITYAGKKN